jgi:hypothetical protein
MRATAIILGIVVAAAGCDKTAGDAPAATDVSLDLAANPDLVFHVFGDRSAPRMLPFAAIRDSELVPITLSAEGWRAFDAKYFQPGATYPTYRDGRSAGTVTVQRGMWIGAPLYTLPGCTNALPMATVAIVDTAPGGYTVEQFAMTRADTAPRVRTAMPADSIRAIAKRLGHEAGRRAGIEPGTLDSLDFRAIAITTGATPRPTIVLSFIDPRGGEGSGGGRTAHVFVIADDAGSGYAASFSHTVNGDAARADYRAFLEHLDLTGDGVSELLLAGWRYGQQTVNRVFAWRGGAWREVFVGRSSWCLDNN